MYIAGEITSGSNRESIAIINPATEEVLGEVPSGKADDINNAVNAGLTAYQEWRFTPASERAEALHQVAAKIRARHDEFVKLLTLEEGKPIPESDEELWWTEETFDYYAELGRHDRGLVVPPGEPGQFNFTLKEPWGVVGCIVPWNYPLLLLAWKVAPALAAGNTVVVKPSELTPLTTLKLATIACDQLPEGVFNVVTGYGREAGEPLVTHPDVRMVAFTGSLATGQRIAKLTAHEMKKLHLELGGKDAMVIAPDVDLDVSIRSLAYASLLNTGQVCTSTERVYVHESLFPQFTEELADFVSTLRLGDGLDKNTDIGPMIRDQFREKVEQHISEAVSNGAHLVIGGERPDEFERGFFFRPTILINVNHEMRIMREETFGPVIPLMPYRDFDEAIRLVNDNPYGLGASLMSNDARLVKRFFEGVEAGTIWINDPLTDNFAGPFGGMKMSGLGRELGQEGFDQFRQVKHVHWDIQGGIKDYWYPY
ncbi:MAG: aldehyde dehydrogenase [Anaerolineales bacterium]|nr:aldehyde dehydrogenase [Anaerolineales bacterium]